MFSIFEFSNLGHVSSPPMTMQSDTHTRQTLHDYILIVSFFEQHVDFF